MIRFPGEIFWTFFFLNNTMMNIFRSLCTHICVIPAKAKAQDQDHRFILQNKFILQRQYSREIVFREMSEIWLTHS